MQQYKSIKIIKIMLKEMYNEKESRNVYSLYPWIHKSDLIIAILMLVELMGPVLICWGGGNPWSTKSIGLILCSNSLGLPRCFSRDAELYIGCNTVDHVSLWHLLRHVSCTYGPLEGMNTFRLMFWHFPEGNFHS